MHHSLIPSLHKSFQLLIFEGGKEEEEGLEVMTTSKTKDLINYNITILLLLVAFSSVEAVVLQDGDGIMDIPSPDEKIFNVVDFGAVQDDQADNSAAFSKAWVAACNHPGKARLVIPPGVFFLSQTPFSGPCKGPSPMVVQIIGTLKGVSDLSMYSNQAWLFFQDVDGLVVFGGGIIDGQGADAWQYNDCDKNSDCSLMPASVMLNKCTNVSFRRLTSLNPKGFHLFISQCKNVRLQKLHIKAPETSPNTDGIHISRSDNVRVARTIIETGDDCIGILQGSTRISVNKVTCGPGHGISVGSLGKRANEEDVVGIKVVNCTLRGTDNGIRIKTYPYNPKVVPIRAIGFLFKDIVMDNVKNPIIINQDYCGSKSRCFGQPSKIEISNIFFNNIIGTSKTELAVNVLCSEAKPCQNVHFNNVHLTGVNGAPSTANCTNAKIGLLGIQVPPVLC